jgi:hypothetical protein
MATPQIAANEKRAIPVSREEIRPMTMTEYRTMIDDALEDKRAGRYISNEEMERRIASWR